MKKVSIIIPNYNNNRYLEGCLRSVIEQDYSEKEIIVIDDGSTDGSIKTIKKIMKQNKNVVIKLICQNNLNAAIARNEGIKVATGDFAIFLDSDDMLKKDVISKMVNARKDSKADLVIGGYEKIDENGNFIIDKKNASEELLLNVKKHFSKLVDIEPAPSNKLYDLNIIRKNDLEWGNVRIGQDLDFYLKYLLLCRKVLLVNCSIYKYRKTTNSISRTYDFRIFDITEVFNDVEKFYEKNDGAMFYKQYIPAIILKHYEYQLAKQIFYTDSKVRKTIVDFFAVNEKKIDYSMCKDGVVLRKMRIRFRLKCMFKYIYTSGLYRKSGLRRMKNERQP